MKQQPGDNLNFPSGTMFWCLGFIYTSFIALIFQKLILPMMPALHAGNGLMINDAILFHELALHAAERIREQGWSQWQLYKGGFGNVGMLSAIYAIFGPNPVCFIPLNAAAHTTGALMIYMIGRQLWPGKIGNLGGLIAGIIFLVFPSALQWYGQNHKDAFAIAGILAMVYAWLSVIDRKYHGNIFVHVLLMFGAASLLAVVRPYYPILMLVSFSLAWLVLLFISIIKNTIRNEWRTYLMTSYLLLVISVVSFVSLRYSNTWDSFYYTSKATITPKEWSWKRSSILPEGLDIILERASRTRAYFIEFNKSINAGSMIDGERSPDSMMRMIAYLPRALTVGIFAPFPNTWIEKVSPPRLVGAIETLLWYIVSSGIVVLIIHRPSRPLLSGLIIALWLIMMLSYVHPNVGTLYRQRFGVWLLILLYGSIGWSKIIFSKILTDTRIEHAPLLQNIPLSINDKISNKKEELAASGSLVLLITICCYIGFMARDLMLIRIYGINAELDIYFTAIMVPMFLISFLSLPISDAVTAPFLRGIVDWSASRVRKFIRNIMSVAVLVSGLATAMIIPFANNILKIIIGAASNASLSEGAFYLRIYALIILLSTWTVVGNCILNALNYSRKAALAQLVVPIITLLTMLIVPYSKILYGAAVGMLLGTLGNALIVIWHMKKLGYLLWPSNHFATADNNEIASQFKRLSLAAFFTTVTMPINYLFASTIDHGAITAWAFAGKVVMLFNGMTAVGITAVVLPHFAFLTAKKYFSDMKSDIFLLLTVGTWAGIGLAIIIFIFSEPLIYILLRSSQVSNTKIKELAEIIRIGCIQLPMIVTYITIVKITAVARHSDKAVFAALVLVVINIICNIILVPRYAVTGIAISTVTATGVSSAIFLLITNRISLLSMNELIIIVISWIMLAYINLSLHFGYLVAFVTSTFGLISLAWATWLVWRTRKKRVLL